MLSTLTLLLLAIGAFLGAGGPGVPVPLEEGSVLRLEGSSTLTDWTCATSSVAAWLHGVPATDPRAGDGAPVGELRVAVATLECGDDRMERDLREAVREGEHPDIAFALTGWELLPDGERFHGRAVGRLTLAGVTAPVEVTVPAEAEPSGGVRAVGRAHLLMTSFGIRPPSAFFGLVKARDAVMVSFDLRADAGTVALLRRHRERLAVER